MTKTTAGPWYVEHIGITDIGPDGIDVYDVGPGQPLQKRIATVAGDDAFLIAAAPDLLEACKMATEVLWANGFNVAARKLDKVISKAEGKDHD